MNADHRGQIDRIRRLIRDVPDFPKPGITFKDITPLLRDETGLASAVDLMAAPFRGVKIDAVVGAESRGFIFAAAVARHLSSGFIPIRKPGKLPAKTRTEEYALEYGIDRVEIHEDSIQRGERVLMVDDVLATGGTMSACCRLVHSLGAEIVGAVFLIELGFLNGRSQLGSYPIHSVLTYD